MPIGPGHPTFTFNALGILANAPAASGVYAICNAAGTYVYFGESNDINRRLSEHMSDVLHPMHSHGAALFAFELHPTQAARVARQNALIQAFPTPCNQRLG